MIHVWHIYLHLVDFYGKCRGIYHTWILWDRNSSVPAADKKSVIKIITFSWSSCSTQTDHTKRIQPVQRLNHLNVSQHPSIRVRRAARELSQGAPPEKVRMPSVMSGCRVCWREAESNSRHGISLIQTYLLWLLYSFDIDFLRSDIPIWETSP